MPKLIHDFVRRQAQTAPEQIAVSGPSEQLTYGQIDARSNQLARLLKEAGCRKGDRIAFCIPKSAAAYITMLGVLKADAVYVPIDAESPAARVEKVIGASRPAIVLGVSSTAKLLDQIFRNPDLVDGVRVGSMDPGRFDGGQFDCRFSQSDLPGYSSADVDCGNRPDDPAHILFTSGSTGTPKGVVITHANVISFVQWGVQYFDINDSDRVSGHAPLHFDLSTFDTYGEFAAGAELHPVPAQLNLLPQKVAEFIRTRQLTQWFSVPSVLNYLAKFDVVNDGDFLSLRRLMWCGEVLPTPTLIYLMERLRHVEFTNLYGPTEATIASSYFTVPFQPESETSAVPIGTACDGEELLVLDSQLRPVRPGEIGDLYIGGVGLSPGYWQDEQKTAAVFLDDPRRPGRRIYKTGDLARIGDDGLVYFLGRADTQIKSRGYRIELGEIETALNAIGLLDESAVVAVDTDGFENKAICCAYVPAPGKDVNVAAIRSELVKAVPKYMVPTKWMSFQKLPKNANGKIDRPRLRTLFADESPAEAGTQTEPAVMESKGAV